MLVLLFSSSAVLAQQLTIRGTVTDERDGAAITGAYVMLQGSDNVVITDIYGNYEIKAQKGATLHYSFLGYLAQDVVVADQKEINVVLAEELTSIDAVVAVGYGVTKKKLVTGANLNVDGDDVAKMNTASAMEALKGTAPGLSVASNNGSPGAGTKVNIRGIGTVGSSSPLYIVDGVEVGNIDNINPLTIESVDVLKDAASAAIYGSRAANGVILVTTKKGRQNQKTTISYSGYYGVQNLAHKPSSMNAQEYMYIYDEGHINDFGTPNDWEAMLKDNIWLNGQRDGLGVEYGQYIWDKLQAGWTGTDWVDEVMSENALQTSHSLNISGGGSKATYALGVGYYKQDGLVGGDFMGAGYERFNFTMNTDMILYQTEDGRPIVKLGENVTYTNSSNKWTANTSVYNSDLYTALTAIPLQPAYWEGSLDKTGLAPQLDGIDDYTNNPLVPLYYQRSQFAEPKNNSITGNIYLDVEPMEGLKFRSSLGINGGFGSSRQFNPTHAGFGGNPARGAVTTNSVSQNMYQYWSYTWTNTLSWMKDFGKHSVNLLVGQEAQASMCNVSMNGTASNLLYNDFAHAYINNANAATAVTDRSVSGVDWAAQGGGLLSYMFRGSYSYDDRYMLDVTVRADGSSAFAEGYKWGYFPSVAAGWNFSEEEFLEDAEWLTFGKLRASWGQNGNQTLRSATGQNVGFAYSSNIYNAPSGNGYYFGDNKNSTSSTAYPANVPNPELTWETSEQLNFGLDLRFFNSRLGFTFDWYDKTTKDWLVESPILGTYGAAAPFINGGEIKNVGTEWSLSWNDNAGDFTYGATFSLSTNKNEVTALEAASGYIEGDKDELFQNCARFNRVEVGMPIGYFYGYKTDGILQNQSEVDAYVNKDGKAYFDDAQPGDVRFVDMNGDGAITDADKTMIGDPNPDMQIGLQLNFGYKGAFLNLTGYGKFGQQVANGYFWGGQYLNYTNMTTEIFGRWHGEGTSNHYPRMSSTTTRNELNISDLYIHDADFFKISNITVGYDFSQLANAEWLSNLSLYVTVTNPFTFTDYKGFDPEVAYGGTNTSWGSGIDLGLYPLPRTWMVGLNLTF